MTSLQIQCFLEVAKHLNFSKAADILFISQSSLSRNIIMLENELDIKLFNRSSFQGTQLTDAGFLLKEAFLQAQSVVSRTIEQIRDFERQKTFTLFLGLLDGQMVDEQLYDLLNEFMNTFSYIRIDIIHESYKFLVDHLHSGKIDAIMTIECEMMESTTLNCFKFYELPTLLVIPKRIPADPTKIHSLADFTDLPFICIEKDDAPIIIELLRSACETAGIEPKIHFVKNLHEQISMIEIGRGIAGFNPYHNICHSQNVRCVEVKEFSPKWFSLFVDKKNINPAAQLFTEFLLERCKQGNFTY